MIAPNAHKTKINLINQPIQGKVVAKTKTKTPKTKAQTKDPLYLFLYKLFSRYKPIVKLTTILAK